MSVSLWVRFRGFDKKTRDFYSVVEHLPQDPAVLTLIYNPREPGLAHVWQKFPCYVLLERGGFAPCLWESDQGIGALKFPVGYLAKARPPAPPLNAPQSFRWEQHASPYDYILTKDEPTALFSERPELALLAERGAWRLWHKRGP